MNLNLQLPFRSPFKGMGAPMLSETMALLMQQLHDKQDRKSVV